MHLECNSRSHKESKSKKSFHSIFINVLTAQIICVHCDIEIYDLDMYFFIHSELKLLITMPLFKIHFRQG